MLGPVAGTARLLPSVGRPANCRNVPCRAHRATLPTEAAFRRPPTPCGSSRGDLPPKSALPVGDRRARAEGGEEGARRAPPPRATTLMRILQKAVRLGCGDTNSSRAEQQQARFPEQDETDLAGCYPPLLFFMAVAQTISNSDVDQTSVRDSSTIFSVQLPSRAKFRFKKGWLADQPLALACESCRRRRRKAPRCCSNVRSGRSLPGLVD